MIDPVATTAAEAWRPLIDWGGALIARGARLAVADGRLVVAGPAWLLTPPVRAALDHHERALVAPAAVAPTTRPSPGAWRGCWPTSPAGQATWSPKARPATPAGSGRCRSCGDPLPAPRGPADRIRCPACAVALRLALRRAREGDLG